jgi:hypothetical protein
LKEYPTKELRDQRLHETISRERRRFEKTKLGLRSKPIICMNDNSEHTSARTASIFYGLGRLAAYRSATYGEHGKHGYKFRWKDGVEVIRPQQSEEAILVEHERRKVSCIKGSLAGAAKVSVAIIDLTTGKEYNRISSVTPDLGISRYNIIKSIKTNAPVCGHWFSYKD